ncbi:MAG: MoaD/ThiS family protein [Lachnospiraceae bacterium]|jgi:hypothetical protein
MSWGVKKIKIPVSFSNSTEIKEYPEGVTVKDIAYEFIEDTEMDGCFIFVNGENLSYSPETVINEGDEVLIQPMMLSGG